MKTEINRDTLRLHLPKQYVGRALGKLEELDEDFSVATIRKVADGSRNNTVVLKVLIEVAEEHQAELAEIEQRIKKLSA